MLLINVGFDLIDFWFVPATTNLFIWSLCPQVIGYRKMKSERESTIDLPEVDETSSTSSRCFGGRTSYIKGVSAAKTVVDRKIAHM